MADTSTQSIVIGAPPDRVAAVICDFPRYPEWADAVKSRRGGRGVRGRLRQPGPFRPRRRGVADEYTLAYEYAEDLSRIEWHLVAPSKMQKAQDGSYDIVDNGDGTSTVTYTLAVELAIAMLGMFKRKAEKMIMDTALKRAQAAGRSTGAAE